MRGALIAAVFVGLGGAAAWSDFAAPYALAGAAMLAALILPVVIYAKVDRVIAAHRRRRRVQSATALIDALVADHLDTLAQRQLTLVRMDHYGVADTTAWDAEVAHFSQKVLVAALSTAQRDATARTWDDLLTAHLRQPVAQRASEIESEGSLAAATGAVDFERACAARLREAGWQTADTPTSGDQGADIIARRGGVSVAIQCKRYSQPVGNKSVQEVFAAQRHYGTDHAAVVTNTDYTRSALTLAFSTGVILLRDRELSRLGPYIEALAANPASRGGRPRYSQSR